MIKSLNDPAGKAAAAEDAKQQVSSEPQSQPATQQPAQPISKQQLVAMRGRARRVALQALYQWQIAEHDIGQLLEHFADDPALKRADGEYFRELLSRVVANADSLTETLTPLLDRPVAQLDVIERVVLFIGLYELQNRPDVPFKVVINEGVKLAKEFGTAESHNYINGVLDKLAREFRPTEIQ